MARKDIDDLEVLAAYAQASAKRLVEGELVWPDELLQTQSGQPEKVVYAAMERTYSRGYLECGVTLRSGWLTPKGAQYLDDNKGWTKGGPRFVRSEAGALILIGSEPNPGKTQEEA